MMASRGATHAHHAKMATLETAATEITIAPSGTAPLRTKWNVETPVITANVASDAMININDVDVPTACGLSVHCGRYLAWAK